MYQSFSSLLLIAASAASFASAHRPHHHHRHEAHPQLVERAGQVITTGANGMGDNQVHPRLEISDLSANRPNQWSLYIQTMAKWQQASQSDPTGYFGISSIHGVPRQSWDGVGQCDSCAGADGYCPHDSVLFPAWHRTYMALYEQEFLNVANQIASSYPAGSQRDAMMAAAQTMRIPYWDWAANPQAGAHVMPTVMSSPQVTINGPNGQETISNPLYSFKFQNTQGMYYQPFTAWPETLRYPTSDASSGSSQEEAMVNAIDNVKGNLQDQIYNLLTACNDYLSFSNDAAGSSSSSCANSIEGIHNTIHTTTGGPGSSGVSGGHMTYLPLAAFDPVFWLHHANVDRLFALWQTVHPDSYGASQTAPHSTWTVASGSTQDANSPLTPFRKDSQNFWTTNDVQDFSNTFKYTYPEFVTSDGSSSAISAYINQLYGNNANATAASISEKVGKTGSSSTAKKAAAPKKTAPKPKASSEPAKKPAASSKAAPAAKNPPASASAPAASLPSPSLPDFQNARHGMDINFGPVELHLGGVKERDMDLDVDTPLGSADVSLGSGSSILPDMSLSLDLNPKFLNPNGHQYEYVCNMHTPRYNLNGSYSVYLFDGQPSSDDCSTWLGDEHMIGMMGVLAGGEMASANLLVSGSVPITRYLQSKVNAGVLPDMSAEHCIPYMTKNLQWKLAKQGEEVPVEHVPDFMASVYSSLSSPAGYDSLPQWSEFIPQVDVTKGKTGGLSMVPSGSPSGYSSAPAAPASTSTCTESTQAQSTHATYAPASSSPVESAPAHSTPAVYSSAPAQAESSPVHSEAIASYIAGGSPAAPSSAAPATTAPAQGGNVPAEGETATAWVTKTATTSCDCEESATPAPVQTAPAQSAPGYSAPPAAPYPTESAPGPVGPVGTAAPSGSGYGASSYPSSSPIAPYTGAGAKMSGSSLVAVILCAIASLFVL